MTVVPGPVTVSDVPLMVVGFIASLKVTVIGVKSTATPVAPQVGAVAVTVGAGPRAVVKLQVLATALTPRELFAAEVMMIVNVVLNARLLAGLKVATLLAAL
jgi:hypothetical protein